MNSQWGEISYEVELKSAEVTKWESRMSFCQMYFKPLLPDPRGSLSEALPSTAIAPLCSRTCIQFFSSFKLEIYLDGYATLTNYSTRNIFD